VSARLLLLCDRLWAIAAARLTTSRRSRTMVAQARDRESAAVLLAPARHSAVSPPARASSLRLSESHKSAVERRQRTTLPRTSSTSSQRSSPQSVCSREAPGPCGAADWLGFLPATLPPPSVSTRCARLVLSGTDVEIASGLRNPFERSYDCAELLHDRTVQRTLCLPR
jgi:hypothetical protein